MEFAGSAPRQVAKKFKSPDVETTGLLVKALISSYFDKLLLNAGISLLSIIASQARAVPLSQKSSAL